MNEKHGEDAGKKPWLKLLWIKQPYPDNYVDSSFLSQLKRNSNVQQYSYWDLVCDSTVILGHISTVVIFAIVFFGIYHLGWNPLTPALCGTGLGLVAYTVWAVHKSSTSSVFMVLKSSSLILFALYALSPVLKTLTQSTSSDSIWAIACWLCLLNIILYDYSFRATKQIKGIFSTNLALSAALVLASRLSTSLAVFSFVVFSIQVFGLFPTFSLWLRTTYFRAHVMILLVLVAVADLGLFHMGGLKLLGLWLFVQGCVLIVFPTWLIRLQKYKNEIEGPWDPAKPVLRNA